MKKISLRDIFLSLIFLLGICLYSYLTRYEMHSAGGDSIRAYKIDKITGKAWKETLVREPEGLQSIWKEFK